MDNCKGCRSNHIYNKGGCNWREYNQNGDCPCVLCIVKSMCNDPCDPYDDWQGDCLNTVAHEGKGKL